jgi:hypothetical protein
MLSLMGTSMEKGVGLEQSGWIVQPAQVIGIGKVSEKAAWRAARYRSGLRNSWRVAWIRSLMLMGMWEMSGQVGTDWIGMLPWLVWIMPGEGRYWSKIRRLLWEVQRVVMVGYVILSVVAVLRRLEVGSAHWLMVGLGGVLCGQTEPRVWVEKQEDGSYQANISGQFRLQVCGESPFRKRLLIVFLGLLQSMNDERSSRRTRDGRTPFVRQEQLASWFGVAQERVSLYNRYWLKGDWANLLSLKTAEVLTTYLIERIVTVCATFPKWSNERVYEYLHQQGVKVSQKQVEQAVEQSGWKGLRASLLERYEIEPVLRLREEWLVTQLFRQVQDLLERIESGQALTPEEQWSLKDLQSLVLETIPAIEPPLPACPWVQQVEPVVFGDWDEIQAETVRCCYCGSTDVGPKSKQPRWKKYYDSNGNLQQVAVYRYYCHNPHCSKKSFTHLPHGLAPYSPYRTQFRLLALQMYAWGYSTYRRAGTAMGLHSMTVWRWVSAWGYALLPVAALFGVVKSSGVVGVDEKYVLVPKNDKPAGKMRRWMYVYMAVDVWTYDLLHIAIHPFNDENSARAFLLALRAKGYRPTVIVTDLRQDYGPLIAAVFPQAEHHECIFHALQNVQKHVKEVYGHNYAEEHPEAELLKNKIYDIFDTSCPSEAQRRYASVFELKQAYLQAMPSSFAIFDFLEHHWPKLLNGIGSHLIPTTNNTVELVIRRFDQHYQNFCGFESIESAQTYLAVFEKLYRFTPFSQDAQPRIRDKSPLQLAGYDVSPIPFSALCSGISIDWPTEVNLVPN